MAPSAPKSPIDDAVREPVSDSERLAILNMVAEGKISIDEAETLLEAPQQLGGCSGSR